MNDRPLIAIVEDEEHISQALVFNLEAEGYRTHHESDGNAALAWLLQAPEEPAAILLDVMLPGRDGFSIARELREQKRHTPIVMLTARGRTEDILEGFAAGSDDYVTKPFELDVLLARLTGLLRRAHWQSADKARVSDGIPVGAGNARHVGDRIINFDALEITAPDFSVQLTVMEAELLRYLMERTGRIVPRKELLENVWRVHEDTDTRAVDNFIVRLRRYIEPNPSQPQYLQTVRGVGYRFVEQPQ